MIVAIPSLYGNTFDVVDYPGPRPLLQEGERGFMTRLQWGAMQALAESTRLAAIEAELAEREAMWGMTG